MMTTAVVVYAAAEERPIVSSVEIIGCERVSPDRIRFVLSTRAGDQLDYLALTDDVRAIERMGPFTGTTVEQVIDRETGQVLIRFRVTELPLVGTLTFDKLGFFQRSGLDKKIQTKIGLYLNPIFVEDDRKALERHFQEKGYAGVKVGVKTPVVSGIADVVFDVDLGFSVSVGEVLYNGLPEGLYTRTIDRALINAPGQSYIAEMMPLDQEAVARTLQDLGWLDAQVALPELHRFDFIRPDEDRRRHGPQLAPDEKYNDRVVVYYDVTPGELWHLGSVAVVGNTVVSESDLLNSFALTTGAVARRSDLEKAVSRCEHLIRNMGYARCNIRVDRRPDPETKLLHLTLHVFEGDLYTLDRVDIHGNYLTKDAVVRRAIRLHPGDLWNEDAFDRSELNVRRTGLFKVAPPNPVRLDRSFDDDRPGKVDMIVNVSEESTGTFRLQLGWSTSTGIFGELGYTERNFDIMKALTFNGWRGGGQILDFSISAGNDTRNATISWTNPHVYDGPFSFTTTFSRTTSTRLDWRERRMMSSVGIGRNFLDNDLRIGLTYTYTDLTISDVQDDATDDALTGAGNYHLNSLTYRTTYDRLDHPRLPTRGYRLAGDVGFTGDPLSASSNCWDYMLNGDVFLPIKRFGLGGTMYVHLSERWRQILPYGDTSEVPFYERYFGGGPAPRHRGFESSELSPRSINTNGFEARDGGTVDTVATMELVVPVQGEDDKIRLVAFVDYGNVFAERADVSLSEMRTSIGFGVRFPVALPVALDFAWLLQPRDGESPNQVHFSLGYSSF